MQNPRTRTDRVGSRHWTASDAETDEPPYTSDENGKRWFSSGLPSEKATISSRVVDALWLALFPVFFIACMLAILVVLEALNGSIGWPYAVVVIVTACVLGLAYVVAGRRIGLA